MRRKGNIFFVERCRAGYLKLFIANVKEWSDIEYESKWKTICYDRKRIILFYAEKTQGKGDIIAIR